MKQLLKDFRDFALKGNFVDLAVAVVIGVRRADTGQYEQSPADGAGDVAANGDAGLPHPLNQRSHRITLIS